MFYGYGRGIGFASLILLTIHSSISEIYEPKLKVTLCSPSKIVINVTDAADGGIIYIQGYGSSCKQETYTGSNIHEFEFDACGVDPMIPFDLIVQKNPLYQTGDDLQVPILCIYETIITVNNAEVIDKVDDTGINMTVRPTAKMKLYKDGLDISAGSVQLGDVITMTIQLDDQYLDLELDIFDDSVISADYDFKAKYCTANTIPLTDEFCPVDTALFPSFVHPSQGLITSTFMAFRSTDLNGGTVEMIYSCTLQLCRGPCSVTTCNGTESWGRRKKRDVPRDEKSVDDVNVGTTLRIGVNEEDTHNVKFCTEPLIVICIITVVMAFISLQFGTSLVLLKQNANLRGIRLTEAIKIWKHSKAISKDKSHSKNVKAVELGKAFCISEKQQRPQIIDAEIKKISVESDVNGAKIHSDTLNTDTRIVNISSPQSMNIQKDVKITDTCENRGMSILSVLAFSK